MERGHLNSSKRSREVRHWSGSGEEGQVHRGQSRYLTRLASLRDSLISQEQMYLAKAVERLRLHSMNHTTSSQRLRMNGSDTKNSAWVNQRPVMLTTIEKFRLTRPRPPPPVMLPIEGKQIFENKSQAGHASKELSDLSTSKHTNEDKVSKLSFKESEVAITSSQVPDEVQVNLERIAQPINDPSAPSADQITQVIVDGVEPSLKPQLLPRPRLLKRKSKQRPLHTFPNLRSLTSSPTCRSTPDLSHRNSLTRPIIPVPIVSSSFHKLETTILAGNIRKRKKINLNSSSTSEKSNLSDADERNEREKESVLARSSNQKLTFSSESLRRQEILNEHQPSLGYEDYRYRHSGRRDRHGNNSRVQGRSFAGKSGQWQLINNTPRLEDSIYRVTQIHPNHPLSRSQISKNSTRIHSRNKGNEVYTDIELQGSNRFSRGEIQDPGLKLVHNIINTSHERLLSQTFPMIYFPTDTKSKETDERHDYQESPSSGDGNPKKHIVVDMPRIIFNAPSPVPDWTNPDEEDKIWKVYGQPNLNRTFQQQKVRVRELTDLLEDVKELSLKTEIMKLQSASVGGSVEQGLE